MYVCACSFQESIQYNCFLATEHNELSDNSETNVDVTTGRYESFKHCHVVDLRWDCVGCDIRNQKTDRYLAMRSCEAYPSSHSYRRINLSRTDIRNLEACGTCAKRTDAIDVPNSFVFTDFAIADCVFVSTSLSNEHRHNHEEL